MQTLMPNNALCRIVLSVAGALAVVIASPFAINAQDSAPPKGPHAGHASQQPGTSDQSLAEQISELQTKVANLEAALKQSHQATTGAADQSSHRADNGLGRMGGMQGGSMQGMGRRSSGRGMGMGSMGMGGKSGMGGMGMGGMGTSAMGGDTAGRGGSSTGMMDQQMMQMMKMMQQMMEMRMMEMRMTGKGMGSDMSDMKGMQTSGMEMGKKGMQMMGGKGMAEMQTPSALPAFPGASHIYHIGAAGFFLDHPEHITLTAEQQTALNQAKEKSLLEQSSFQGKIDDAEQELWTLTASDQPEAEKIEAKVREIEKLRSDQRLALIRSVGEAADVLTDEQRKTLVGTTSPNHSPTTPGDQN